MLVGFPGLGLELRGFLDTSEISCDNDNASGKTGINPSKLTSLHHKLLQDKTLNFSP